MCELAKRITVPVVYGFYERWKLWRRYGSRAELCVLQKTWMSRIEGKDVLIVEDIIDSGRYIVLI